MRGKKGGEMLSEGLAPWSLSSFCVCLQEPSLVVHYGKETCFVLFDVVCLMHVVKDGVLKRYC